MTPRLRCHLFRLAVACFLIAAVPAPSLAMTAAWGKHPASERLVFKLDNATPVFSLSRIGTDTLALSFKKSFWDKESKLGSLDLTTSKLVRAVTTTGEGLVIITKTPAFGYLFYQIEDENKIVVELYSDPMGTRWKSKEKEKPVPIKTVSDKPVPGTPIKGIPEKSTKAVPQPSSDKILRESSPAKTVSAKPTVAERPRVVLPVPLNPNASVLEKSDAVLNGTARAKDDEVKDVLTANSSSPGSETETKNLENSTAATPGNAMRAKVVKTGPGFDPANATDAIKSTKEGGPALSGKEDTNFAEMLLMAQAALANGDFETAMGLLEIITAKPNVPPDIMEKALYGLADLYLQVYQADLKVQFSKVFAAYEKAMKFNPKSSQIPRGLLSTGILQLRVGNDPEAKAYFNLLRRKYPKDPAVPETYYYWGDYYYRKKDYSKAADEFQVVVQKYPESVIVKDAAVALARALTELQLDDQAAEIVDFVSKRWPKHYLEDPGFLRLEGRVALQRKDYPKAKEKYWINYNLAPEAEGVDLVLARLGDIYALSGDRKTAIKVLEMAALRYPDKEGGFIAKMRLIDIGEEEGRPDIFKAINLDPEKVYGEVLKKFPDSPLAPVAQLKLLQWHVKTGQYENALGDMTAFLTKFPKNDLAGRAEEAGIKAFDSLVAGGKDNAALQKNVLALEANPSLWGLRERWAVPTQLAIGRGLLLVDDSERAMVLAKSILEKMKSQGQDVSPALDLVLQVVQEGQKWKEITELAETYRNAKLSPEQRSRLDLALALALENLGQTEKSAALWQRLAIDPNLKPVQRAEALFFLGKGALIKNDIQRAEMLGQEALAIFQKDAGASNRVKDTFKFLMDVAEKAGRPAEALRWAVECEKMITVKDAEWPAFRYRVAKLHRKAGDFDRWKGVLEDIQKQASSSPYAKLAASDAKSYDLEKRLKKLRAP